MAKSTGAAQVKYPERKDTSDLEQLLESGCPVPNGQDAAVQVECFKDKDTNDLRTTFRRRVSGPKWPSPPARPKSNTPNVKTPTLGKPIVQPMAETQQIAVWRLLY